MDLELFVTPVAGAVIGYFTNWLAIKMLFRPHEEKKIFGISLPFTPGLMPKERYRLSKKIGETVAEHIITKEVLKQELLNETTVKNTAKVLKNVISDIENNTVSDILKITGLEPASAYNKIEGIFMDSLLKYLKDDKQRRAIVSELHNIIINLLKYERISEIIENMLIHIKPHFFEYIEDYLKSNAFEQAILKGVSNFKAKLYEEDKSVREYLPENVVKVLQTLLNLGIPKLANIVKTLPENNTKLDVSLFNLVSKVIDENLGSFAVMFINKSKVYENIKEGIINYLSDFENLNLMSEKTENFILSAMEKNISEYINKLPKDFDLSSLIIRFIHQYINHQFTDDIFDYLLKELKNGKTLNLYDIITKSMPEEDTSKMISNFVQEKTDCFFDVHASRLLKSFTSQMEAIILSCSLKKVSDGITEMMPNIFEKLAYFILDKAATNVLQSVDISRIAEKQINGFDMQKAEEIVLSVVHKELNAITILGGVLGFLIGLFTLLTRFIG